MTEDEIKTILDSLYCAGQYQEIVSFLTDDNYQVKYNSLYGLQLLTQLYYTGPGVEYNATLAYIYAKQCKDLYGQSADLEHIESAVGDVAPLPNELSHPIRSSDYNQFLWTRIRQSCTPIGGKVLKELMVLYRWAIGSGLKHLLKDYSLFKWFMFAMISKEEMPIATQYLDSLRNFRYSYYNSSLNLPSPQDDSKACSSNLL